MGIPDNLICLLRNLYADEEATVRTRHGTMDWFQIGKRACQSCMLSHYLFHLYAEYRMEEIQVEIKIAGRNINNLRYADNTMLMAESEKEPKSLLMNVKEEREKERERREKKLHSKNEDAFQSHHFIASRWGNNGNTERVCFFWLQNHCRW